jgi:hypothetical protein
MRAALKFTVAIMTATMAIAWAAAAGGWDHDDRWIQPAPVYVYDHRGGPTWTSNGWSYPPVFVYYPRPVIYPAYVLPPDCRAHRRLSRPHWCRW